MKQKTFFVFLLSAVLLAMLIACSRGVAIDTEENDSDIGEEYLLVSDDDNDGETSLPAPSPDDVFASGLTRSEYLEDLDYLYELLTANFPHFAAMYRTRGVDLHQSLRELRRVIEDEPASSARVGNPNLFRYMLQHYIFRPANHFGHFRMLDESEVRGRLAHDLSVEAEWSGILAPFVEVMNNAATREFYGLTDANFEPRERVDAGQGRQGLEIVTRSGNVETRILEDGRIAYVRIRQMSASALERDYLELIEFYRQIASYEHLIIDIRGNPGGTSSYFPRLVMAPNISETLHYRQYFFIMAGEHNMRFLTPWIELGYMDLSPVTDRLFDDLPYFCRLSRELLDYYMRIDGVVEPSRESAIFSGKIWLLIDGNNFSASGQAAEMVKQTGFATLVGEQTDHSGGGMTPTILALPNSGIVVQYQTIYGTNSLGQNTYEFGTLPHIANFEGMDALRTTLALIESEGM